MAYTKTSRNSESYEKTVRNERGEAARFGIARFGVARFGRESDATKTARNSGNYTKTARNT